jgi:hypothetical protein
MPAISQPLLDAPRTGTTTVPARPKPGRRGAIFAAVGVALSALAITDQANALTYRVGFPDQTGVPNFDIGGSTTFTADPGVTLNFGMFQIDGGSSPTAKGILATNFTATGDFSAKTAITENVLNYDVFELIAHSAQGDVVVSVNKYGLLTSDVFGSIATFQFPDALGTGPNAVFAINRIGDTFQVYGAQDAYGAPGLVDFVIPNITSEFSFSMVMERGPLPAGLDAQPVDPYQAFIFNEGLTITVPDTLPDNGGGCRVALACPTNDVPEPSTWALMLAGFGLAGITLRRLRSLSAGTASA